MLNDHIRTAGMLAGAIVIRACRPDSPDDLAVIASDVATDPDAFEPVDPAALQHAIIVASSIMEAFRSASITLEALERAELSHHFVDDTGPPYASKRRGPRWIRQVADLFKASVVVGVDGDRIAVGATKFENGEILIRIGADANRAGPRPACFLDAAQAAEVIEKLRQAVEHVGIVRGEATSPGPDKAPRRRPRKPKADGGAP